MKPIYCVPLLFCLAENLQAKVVSNWYELNQNPSLPPVSNLTIFENSVLNVILDNTPITPSLGNSRYDGSAVFNANLKINATLEKSLGKETTTLYHLGNSQGKSFQGNGNLEIELMGSTMAKSVFNIVESSHFSLAVNTKIQIQNNQEIFSIFRSADQSSLKIDKNLEVDLSQAQARFPNGLKAIFDIDGGSVFLNTTRKSQNVVFKLKGDIFSTGKLESYMNNNQSYFEGKMHFVGNSQSKFSFYGGSQANSEITLQENASLVMNTQDQGSQIQGKLIASSKAISAFDIALDAKAKFDFDLSDESSAKLALSGRGEFTGNFVAGGSTQIDIFSQTASKVLGTFDLKNSNITSLEAKNINTLIQGQFNLADNASLTLTLLDQAKAQANISLLSSPTLKLSSTQAFYKGKITLDPALTTASEMTLDFKQSSEANFALDLGGTFSLTLNAKQSTLKTKISLSETSTPKFANLSIDDSKLYATISQSSPQHLNLALTNNGIWYMQENTKIANLTLNNPTANLHQTRGSSVDMRFLDYGGAKRNLNGKIDSKNRLVLETKSINGENGIFRIMGVFNREGWGKDENGRIIATDKIITTALNGNHIIQVYWDMSNFDPKLAEENLAKDYIVVAEQKSLAENGNFVGASMDVGVFAYETKLKKVKKTDNSGYDWILDGKEETPPPPPPLPLHRHH